MLDRYTTGPIAHILIHYMLWRPWVSISGGVRQGSLMVGRETEG